MKVHSKSVQDIASVENNGATTIQPEGTIGELVSLFAADSECTCVYIVDSQDNIHGYIGLKDLVADMSLYLQNLNNDYFNVFIDRFKEAKVTAIMRTDCEWVEYNSNIAAMIHKMLIKGRTELPIATENGKIIGCVKMRSLLELIDGYQQRSKYPPKGPIGVVNER